EGQVPPARPNVLPHRPLVAEHRAPCVANDHIRRSVAQIAPAHLRPGDDLEDSPIEVDDLDELVGGHSSTTLMACFRHRCTASLTRARAVSGGVSFRTYMKSSSRTSKMSGATCMQMALDSQRS